MSGPNPTPSPQATPRQVLTAGAVGLALPACVCAAVWWLTAASAEPLRSGTRIVMTALCCALALCAAAHVCTCTIERLLRTRARTVRRPTSGLR